MIVEERTLGRIFRIHFDEGEEVVERLTSFVRERGIRAATVFLYGAVHEGEMIEGFRSTEGYDVSRVRIGPHCEYVALGTVSWPERPPAALGEGVRWEEPQPFVHLHLAASGPAGRCVEETRVGHLSAGVSVAAFADLYEIR